MGIFWMNEVIEAMQSKTKYLAIQLYPFLYKSQHSECKKLGGNDPSGCHHPLGFCCSAQHCRLPQLSRLSSLSQMGIFWMDEVIEAVMGHSLQSMLQWAIEPATQLLEVLRGQQIKLICVVFQFKNAQILVEGSTVDSFSNPDVLAVIAKIW